MISAYRNRPETSRSDDVCPHGAWYNNQYESLIIGVRCRMCVRLYRTCPKASTTGLRLMPLHVAYYEALKRVRDVPVRPISAAHAGWL